MPDAYTYVSKPTSSIYSYANPEGKQQYDQNDIAYDDPSVFYDSYNPNAYTNVSKPTSDATWDEINSTWNQMVQSWDEADDYTKVSKPTT